MINKKIKPKKRKKKYRFSLMTLSRKGNYIVRRYYETLEEAKSHLGKYKETVMIIDSEEE